MHDFEVLIGTWHVAGEIPMDPPMHVEGETTFERLGEFLVMRSNSDEGAVPDSIAIIGGAPDGGPQPMHYFDERGIARMWVMRLDGRMWTYWRAPGEDWNGPMGPGFNQRFIGELSADARTIEARAERGLGPEGDQWELDFPLTYTRM